MGLVRTLILKGSQNDWLRKHAQSFPFVRRAVSRFMPGEHLDDAIAAAQKLASQGIIAMLTKVGENVTDADQATAVTDHYLEVVRHIRETDLQEWSDPKDAAPAFARRSPRTTSL